MARRRSRRRSSRPKQPPRPGQFGHPSRAQETASKTPATPTDAALDEFLEPQPESGAPPQQEQQRETEQDRIRRELQERIDEDQAGRNEPDEELDRRLMPRRMRRYMD